LDAAQAGGRTNLDSLNQQIPVDAGAGSPGKTLPVGEMQSSHSTGEPKPVFDLTQAVGQRPALGEAEETGHPGGRQTEMSAPDKGPPAAVDPAEQFADPAARPVRVKDARPQAEASIPSEAAPAKSVELSAAQQAVLRSQGESSSHLELEGKSVRVAVDDTAQRMSQHNPSANRDGSLLYHQEQGFDRTLESVTAAKEKETAPAAWRAQTLEQIVAKAVYQLKNGISEVKIDLKPEFLGQVRLQIVTENHQVTVRIFAELPVVKEMIENSLQQLRADLQQQGLEIDGLEVFTSSDSHRGEHKGEKLAGRPNGPEEAARSESDADTTAEPGLPRVNRSASGRVDTFA
jgi:flagellar hook-length control protein FliK